MTAEEIWSRYQSGVNFKSEIDLYEMVAKNERFFAGDQWAGVNAPDLPKPVVNFIKKACQQKIAEVASCPVRVSFSALEFGDGVVLPEKENIPAATDGDAQLLNGLFESDWDRLGMDSLNLDGLTDACISGDYLLYNYWDDTAETGQAARGRVCVEIVDNVNYYPADPNDKEIQRQR
ncbi:MAG TPA: hypothetical protein VHR42_04170, partial [Clostridia bacterium]|nr:hypothetical protein [Clostridia bacterium]